MAITSGYYNSKGGDRKYNAETMSKYYGGILSRGVLQNYEGKFKVQATSGLTVAVQTGKAYFSDGKWIENTAVENLTLDAADIVLDRIDRIVLRKDISEGSRTAVIAIKKGTPASNPTWPTLTRNDYIEEMSLCQIRVRKLTETITQADITDERPMSTVCGFVHGLVNQIDTDDIFTQYDEAAKQDRVKNQAEFDDWFNDIKETLSSSTLIRSYDSTYITAAENEKVIPVNISQFNKNTDILQVYINGLKLIPGLEYALTSNEQITLTRPVGVNTPISFEVFKSIDGSDAETVVQQVYELQEAHDKTKILTDAGAVKLSISDTTVNVLSAFTNLGMGFHTVYAASGVQGLPKTGAFRLFGQITTINPAVGYIFAMQADGSVYSNYLNAGTWLGWKVIFESAPLLLYQSTAGVFPNADVAITPNKTLSDCQNGWALTFTGYDDTAKTARDYYVQTIYIPKRSCKGEKWNGESMTFSLVYSYNQTTDTNLQCTKTFTIYNDRLISSSFNSQGKSRNIVLRSIQEY